MQPVEIPRYIDDPVHFLLWSADEIAPIGLGLVIGILAGSPAYFTLAGLALTSVYSRYRDSKPDGFALHYLYWQGLMKTKCKAATNPFIRRFYP